MATLAAGTGIGAGLAAVLHGAVRGPNSFRWLFAIAVIPLLVLPRLLRVLRAVTVTGKTDATLGSVPRPLRGPVVVMACVAFAIGVIGGPANGFAFVYGEGVQHLAPSTMSAVVLLCAVTGLAGLLAGNALSRRFGLKRTLVFSVLTVATMATVAYGGARWQFVLGYLIGIGASGAMSPVLATLATQIFPKSHRATCAGWVLVAGVIGAVVGLEFFGYAVDAWHASHPWRFASLVTFWPALSLLIFLPRISEQHRD
jgi:MFS family permease